MTIGHQFKLLCANEGGVLDAGQHILSGVSEGAMDFLEGFEAALIDAPDEGPHRLVS